MKLPNKFAVGYEVSSASPFLRADPGVIVHCPPKPQQKLSVDDALNLAAWLVATADPAGDKFKEILSTIGM